MGDARQSGHFRTGFFNPVDMLCSDANNHIDSARDRMDGLHCRNHPHFRDNLSAAETPLKLYHQISALAGASVSIDNREAGDGAGSLQFGQPILRCGTGEAEIACKCDDWTTRVAPKQTQQQPVFVIHRISYRQNAARAVVLPDETGTKCKQAVHTEAAMKPEPIRAFLPPIACGRQLIIGPRRDQTHSPAATPLPKQDVETRNLWSKFWQEFCVENAPYERCYVPGDGQHAVDHHWAQFAAKLPREAQVIDLGCGAGIVGLSLLNGRSDLSVAGVDWAYVPMMEVPNLTIHPRTSMEALPFGEDSFDAAVSLFGIEYGNMDKTVGELTRVLKPGAPFSFLVHHRESEILREGNARRRALKELIWGNMKVVFLAGNTAGVNQQRQTIRSKFPDEPMVNLVSDYFIRNIEQARAERQALWQKLADDLEPEVLLLMHLERAAKSAIEMGAWLVSLLSTMSLVNVSVLRRSAGEPIAWNVSGIR